jgi:GT2 family glycosyltransferase
MSDALAVIIVNHNAGGFLLNCVDSLLACTLDIEIIMVDNALHDDRGGVPRCLSTE